MTLLAELLHERVGLGVDDGIHGSNVIHWSGGSSFAAMVNTLVAVDCRFLESQ